eukprot:7693390-Karenia_brevis.AAC.1
MFTFRQAWSGVTAILVVNPVVMLTSNNQKWTQTHLLEEALPQMSWNQPRNNRRAVYLTSGYMADLMGCP